MGVYRQAIRWGAGYNVEALSTSEDQAVHHEAITAVKGAGPIRQIKDA